MREMIEKGFLKISLSIGVCIKSKLIKSYVLLFSTPYEGNDTMKPFEKYCLVLGYA